MRAPVGTFILRKGLHTRYGCLWGVSFRRLALNAWGVGVVVGRKDGIPMVLEFVRWDVVLFRMLSAVMRVMFSSCFGVSGRAFRDTISSTMVLAVPGWCQVLWYLRYHACNCRVPQALLRDLAPGWDLLRMRSPISLAHLLLVHHGGPEVVTQALRLRGSLVPGEAGSKFPVPQILFPNSARVSQEL